MNDEDVQQLAKKYLAEMHQAQADHIKKCEQISRRHLLMMQITFFVAWVIFWPVIRRLF